MGEYNGNEIHDGLIEVVEDLVIFRAVWGLVLLGVAVVVIGFMVMLICA